jgi:hypothetical protein
VERLGDSRLIGVANGELPAMEDATLWGVSSEDRDGDDLSKETDDVAGPQRPLLRRDWRFDVDNEDDMDDKLISELESAYCKDLTLGLGVEVVEDSGDSEELRKEDEADGEEEAEEEESTDMERELASIPESVEFFRSRDLIRGQARGVESPRCL